MSEVGKRVRIEEIVDPLNPTTSSWRTLPNAMNVPVWEKNIAEAKNSDDQVVTSRHIFHIPFTDGVARGNRLTYLGSKFIVLKVSNSPQLIGLELLCDLA